MARKNILLLGGNGQVGRALRRAAPPYHVEIAAPGRDKVDLAAEETLARAIENTSPALVINAAAYTDVDGAEGDPAAAFAVNRDGPAAIARLCAAAGVPLLHISTDYVFDGAKDGPYVETDAIAPMGVYGASKAEGEALVRDAAPAHVILRTAWVFSADGKNFVRTMLRLADTHDTLRVVADQRGCPTPAADIADALLRIGARLMADGADAPYGTYHFCGAGPVSWHGFAEAIFAVRQELTAISPPEILPIGTADYPTAARRPANSVLDCGRIAQVFGIVQRPWCDGLGDVMRALNVAPQEATS